MDRNYRVMPDLEFTVEANPDDISPEWLEAMSRTGVNRISMGVQTFHDGHLKLLRRRHNSERAIQAVHLCQEHGFRNISIDLIYGLPEQTLEEWKADVAQAIALNVQHLSAYALIYEENTALWRMREQNMVQEADEELSLSMFEYLITELKNNGFEHYEISNFGLPGFHSRHNSSYWNDTPYLGCGASAHSFIGMERMYNTANIDHYIKDITRCRKENLPYKEVCHCEVLDRYEHYNDRIITGLRTAAGLDLEKLEQDFGTELKNYCLKMAAPHLKENTLQITEENGHPQGVLKLSHRGLFLSDGIMSDLLWVD
jgi:putative oxygen-independent coproporphyrinogen III oxidase